MPTYTDNIIRVYGNFNKFIIYSQVILHQNFMFSQFYGIACKNNNLIVTQVRFVQFVSLDLFKDNPNICI